MNRRAWLASFGCLAIERSVRGAAPRFFEPDFEALFDGESLAGWTRIGGEPGGWRAEKGCLVARPGKNWLSTNQVHGDFDLRLDYRVERGGNSGVLLRAPHRGDPSFEGLEVQILDDDAPGYRQLKPEQYSGSIYGVIAARRGFVHPAGTWNRLAIRLKASRVRVALNETAVVDARLDGQPASVVKRHPGLARSRGFIGLQAHDTPVWFRAIALRSLA